MSQSDWQWANWDFPGYMAPKWAKMTDWTYQQGACRITSMAMVADYIGLVPASPPTYTLSDVCTQYSSTSVVAPGLLRQGHGGVGIPWVDPVYLAVACDDFEGWTRTVYKQTLSFEPKWTAFTGDPARAFTTRQAGADSLSWTSGSQVALNWKTLKLWSDGSDRIHSGALDDLAIGGAYLSGSPVVLEYQYINAEGKPFAAHAVVLWDIDDWGIGLNRYMVLDPGRPGSMYETNSWGVDVVKPQMLGQLEKTWTTAPYRIRPIQLDIPVVTPVGPKIWGDARSPVDLLVTDPTGRKVGVDPSSDRTYDEIPGALYSKSEDVEATPPAGHDGITTEFTVSAPIDGIYRVEAIGNGSGPVFLDLKSWNDRGQPSADYHGAFDTSPGEVKKYQMTSSPEGVIAEVSNFSPQPIIKVPENPVVWESATLDGSASFDVDGHIDSWHWEFDDGTTASGEKISHVFPEPGLHKVVLVVTDELGLPTTTQKWIRVLAPPVMAPIADRQIDIYPGRSGTPTTTVAGKIATFTDADGGWWDVTYDWGDGDSYTDTEPKMSWSGATANIEGLHEYAQPGVYRVTLTVTDEYGLSDTKSFTVTITVHDVDPMAAPLWACSTGEAVALDAHGWDPNGGTVSLVSTSAPAHGSVSIDGSTITYTPDATWAGIDEFTYTVAKANGKTASAVIAVGTVRPAEQSSYTYVGQIGHLTADGGETDEVGGLGVPADLAMTPDGNILEIDHWLYAIKEFSPDGTQLMDINLGFEGLEFPIGVACDSQGRIYAAYENASVPSSAGNLPEILRFTPQGQLDYTWRLGTQNEYPYGMTTDGQDQVYLTSLEGTWVFAPGGGTLVKKLSYGGMDIAVDSAGNTYSDGGRAVEKRAPDGSLLLILGGDGTPEGGINIRGLAVDKDDNVFVADWGNDRVLKYSPSGELLCIIARTLDTYWYTWSVTVGSDGTVYVGAKWDNGDQCGIDVFKPNSGGPVNTPPIALDSSIRTLQNTPVHASLCAGDLDGDTLSYRVTTEPTNGTVTLDGSTATYTPDPGFSGPDAFGYMVNDGSADSEEATVQVTVDPRNSPPVAVDDRYETDENQALQIGAPGVLANDSDADGTSLSAILLLAPKHGTVTLDATGALDYTPAPDFHGTDTFTYTVSDGDLHSPAAAVTIEVRDTNRPPVAADDTYSVEAGSVLSASFVDGVLTNDTDPDGDALKTFVLEADAPSHGAVMLKEEGSFVYAPDKGYAGIDYFTYTARDADGLTSRAMVYVDVRSPYAAPEAVDDECSIDENETLFVQPPAVLLNDHPGSDGQLTASLVSQPSSGTARLAADGALVYVPPNDFHGDVTLTYTVSDGFTTSSPATVLIHVLATDHPPVLSVPNEASAAEGSTASLSGTCTDPQNDVASLTADRGSVELAADGSFNWTLTTKDGPAESGPVTLTAADAQGSETKVTFQLTVTNVAPAVAAIVGPVVPAAIGESVACSAAFSDAGILDTHAATWNWGDGTTSTGTVTETNGSGSVTGTHTYTQPYVYIVTLTVTDNDGGQGSSTFEWITIYRPVASVFITGGGWTSISSGRTSFGFNAGPNLGAYRGQLQVSTNSGKNRFHGNVITSLTSATPTTATWSGTGSWNKLPGYSYTVSVVDNGSSGSRKADTISILIKSPPGTTVFTTNGPQVLKGGNITVHH